MKTLTEWMEDKGIEELDTDSILENQLEQLVTRLNGLIHDNDNKKAIVEKFIKDVEKRVLGN